MIKKILYSLMGLSPLISLAHGDEMDEMEEMSEFSHQMGEIFPFEHIEEGHWIAFIVISILWISFVYAVYTLIKKRKSSNP